MNTKGYKKGLWSFREMLTASEMADLAMFQNNGKFDT